MSSPYEEIAAPTQFHLPQWLVDTGNVGHVEGVELKRYYLLNSGIANLRVVKSSFTQFNMLDAKVEGVNFLFSEFKESDFNSVTFSNCYFKGMLFENCSFRNIEFVRCVFDSCRFQFANPLSQEDNVAAKDCTFMTPDFTRDDLMRAGAAKFDGCLFFCDELPKELVGGNRCLEIPSVTRPIEKPKADVNMGELKKPSLPTSPVPQSESKPRTESPEKPAGGGRFDRLEV